MNDACSEHISNEMVFAIFRGSHCSENEDGSREATLTIHVNVDEVALHLTVRNFYIVTLLAKSLCSKQDERRRFEGTKRARSSRICFVGQTAEKNHYRLPQWSRMRKDHLTLVQVSFASWRNDVSRFISHWIVLCKFGHIRQTSAHTRHVSHTNNQRHNHTHKETNYKPINQSHERKDQRT